MSHSTLLQRIPDPLGLPPDPDDPRIEYQSMLRVIGAMLDQLKAADVAIIDGFEGFTVRFCAEDECEIRELSYDDLLEAYRTLRTERTLLGAVDRGYYQDFLRATGYELQQVYARNLLLAEAGDHFLLTYQTTESAGSARRTNHVLLAPPAVKEILDRAHRRRAAQTALDAPSPRV